MVEIFKTNVTSRKLAETILKKLLTNFPECLFNFDLDDCDRILRAQNTGCDIEINRIIRMVKDQGAEISLFTD